MKQTTTQTTAAEWIPIVDDYEQQSFAYFLPFTEQSWTTQEQLDEWFDALHPSRYLDDQKTGKTNNDAKASAWTDSYHCGVKLLRKTAWVPLDPMCQCEYGYADTWQHQATDPKFVHTIKEITDVVISHFVNSRKETKINGDTLTNNNVNNILFNAVNLNYYPHGGGIGFHADDEFLFDGLNRPTCILSLSLCSRPRNGRGNNSNIRSESSSSYDGSRKFIIRRKIPGDTEDSVQIFDFDDNMNKGNKADRDRTSLTNNNDIEVILRHGDLMTMEGMFQKNYYHAVWPGDSKLFKDSSKKDNGDDEGLNDDDDSTVNPYHRFTGGERINLTWRMIVKHLDGSEEACRGKTCQLSVKNQLE